MPTESILRSRYHHLYPITSKDPITNQVVVGEVEFYLLNKDYTDAEFFGTDFNYASSKLFRERFDELTPEKELLDLGIRVDLHNQNGNVIDPNQFQPIIPMHGTDQKSFSSFMETL